jgi:prepilin-type N-terminal cleavage/methylation domain-containing protein
MSQSEAPSMTKHHRTKAGRAGGFTLVELLVVIGIIVILVSILVPVVGRVKSLSQATATQAQIASIAAACERYYADFKAYPGPISNLQLQTPTNGATPVNAPAVTKQTPGNPTAMDFPAGVVTSTENLVLGLMGGLEPVPDPTNPTPDITKVGNGPMSLNPIASARRRSPAYVDNTNWLSNQSSNLPEQLYGTGGTSWEHLGTSVPEFMDRFGDPRPILYLRARVGAPLGTSTQNGVAGDNSLQYNYTHLEPYKRPRGSTPTDLPSDFDTPEPSKPGPFQAEDWVKYLGLPGATATATGGVTPPRGKDRFILISAGADGVFGTKDDIFNQ